MNEGFKENALKPGDRGFQYDKEVEFQEAEESNEWDMSGSLDDF